MDNEPDPKPAVHLHQDHEGKRSQLQSLIDDDGPIPDDEPTKPLVQPLETFVEAMRGLCELLLTFKSAEEAKRRALTPPMTPKDASVEDGTALQRSKTATQLLEEVNEKAEEQRKKKRVLQNLNAVMSLSLPVSTSDTRPVSFYSYKRLTTTGTDAKKALERLISVFDTVYGTAGLQRHLDEMRVAERNIGVVSSRPSDVTLAAIHRYVWASFTAVAGIRLVLFPAAQFPLVELGVRNAPRHRPPKTDPIVLPDPAQDQARPADLFTLAGRGAAKLKLPETVDFTTQLATVALNAQTKAQRDMMCLPPSDINCTVSLWADEARRAQAGLDGLLGTLSHLLGDVTRFTELWAQHRPHRRPRFTVRSPRKADVGPTPGQPSGRRQSLAVKAKMERAAARAEVDDVISRQTCTQEAFRLNALLRAPAPDVGGDALPEWQEKRVEEVLGITISQLGWT